MNNTKIIERIKEYLEDNKQASESIDVQIDSSRLLLWIEKWEAELEGE